MTWKPNCAVPKVRRLQNEGPPWLLTRAVAHTSLEGTSSSGSWTAAVLMCVLPYLPSHLDSADSGSLFHPEANGPAGNDEAEVVRVRSVTGSARPAATAGEGAPSRAAQPSLAPPAERAAPMPAGYGVMGDDGSMDYSVHEAWNEATNVYLVVILVSFGLFMYAKRNKRKIMRIFSVPPTAETLSEPNFYDTISKIRLRQQLEMYSISRKYDYQQPQNQADSVQLSLE